MKLRQRNFELHASLPLYKCCCSLRNIGAINSTPCARTKELAMCTLRSAGDLSPVNLAEERKRAVRAFMSLQRVYWCGNGFITRYGDCSESVCIQLALFPWAFSIIYVHCAKNRLNSFGLVTSVRVKCCFSLRRKENRHNCCHCQHSTLRVQSAVRLRRFI